MSEGSEDKLQALAEACVPATFGRNQVDVLDESYRKAGKLDITHFATNVNPQQSPLIRILRSQLLEGGDAEKAIKVQLYKLNTYGKGSFFKPHQDTPRAENMFGSLVIIYPSAHEGGTLIFRHKGEEWSFDAAEALAGKPPNSVAYAMFYSDVEHEVTMVDSGYRVTLTYNLYYDDLQAVVPMPVSTLSQEDLLKETFQRLLEDTTFLPEGGRLGFGLRHQYPIDPSRRSLRNIFAILKGSDGILKRVAEKLSLDVSLRVIYWEEGDEKMIMSGPNEFEYIYEHEGPEDMTALDEMDGTMIQEGENRDWRKVQKVYWVTPFNAVRNRHEQPHVAHFGNEASLSYVYGDVALLIQVGPFGKRARTG
ncbi:hypothetical protein GLOTRDRAFT_115211 [Gloeophyllum trabeum ATCC 11539]|uniref:Prolyl 4-hydroxylase alpha subunit Fe(2+) 2OG dioxygenase domain-containing protein n=1 Tax=Gloeophyllum trabeum (strain ATCC 11539 / FP-39264 / Madison 617) TaxID=670483 RepID=S7QB65_GLOTA|nr:uncharacterized protein GLOTRDRAFT_115211 [Gloeophyllum trabeum ATCC 11539]EPQ57176.1 hypothetical protein GLOTRDRAFT_115211 [Gloeophyllum trabeum ATCC 11539]